MKKKLFYAFLFCFIVSLSWIVRLSFTAPYSMPGRFLFQLASTPMPIPSRSVQASLKKFLLFQQYRMLNDGMFSLLWGNFLTRGVVYSGNYVFAGMGSEVAVFDVSSPNAISLIKKVPLYGTAYAVSHDKDTLYLASGHAGLSVVDISSPRDARRIGWLILPQSAYARWLALRDGYVYLATDKGLMIINVKDRAHPALVKQLLYEPVKFSWVDGDTLYLTLLGQRIFAYDISKRGEPVFLSKLDLSYPTNQIEIDPPPGYLVTFGKYAYVANGHKGVTVLDVSNRKAPRVLRSVYLDGKYTSFITLYKNTLSVQTADRMYMLDIAKPSEPVIAKVYEGFGGYLTTGFYGDRQVFVPRRTGFYLVDTKDGLLKPRVLGHYFDPPTARGVFADDKNLYLANGSGGLEMYTMDNPAAPSFTRKLNVLGYANGMSVSSPHIYLSEGIAGVSVTDTRDKNAEATQKYFDLENVSWNVTVHNHIAYVSSSEQGLTIFDVKNPMKPMFLGKTATKKDQGIGGGGTYMLNLAVQFPRVYLVGITGDLYVYNVSDPRKPVLEKTFNAVTGMDIAVKENTAYVAGFRSGVQVVNLKNSRDIRSYKTGGKPVGLHLEGNRLYVADFDKGLLVYDISNPKSLTLEKTYKTKGNAREVFVKGHFAYVADWKAGLTVIDLEKGAVL